jgi:hypothetical protein
MHRIVLRALSSNLLAQIGIGVFQEYYQSHQLKQYTSQEIAWIPSLEAFMMFIGGLWVGRVYGKPSPASSTGTTR